MIKPDAILSINQIIISHSSSTVRIAEDMQISTDDVYMLYKHFEPLAMAFMILLSDTDPEMESGRAATRRIEGLVFDVLRTKMTDTVNITEQ